MEPLCDWIRLIFWIIYDRILVGKLSQFPADVIYITLDLSNIRLSPNSSLATYGIQSIHTRRYFTF